MKTERIILQGVPTHVTREQLAELRDAGNLIDGQWVLVTVHGRQALSPVRLVQPKEQRS